MTSSNPPISSHLVFGTSTCVYLKEAGLTLPIANLKCYWDTAIAYNIFVSIDSASISMISIFYLIHCKADYVHKAAISEPTKPCVSLATD